MKDNEFRSTASEVTPTQAEIQPEVLTDTDTVDGAHTTTAPESRTESTDLQELRIAHELELKRCLADQANLQRRLMLQVENARQFGSEKLLASLLPVLDTLEKNVLESQLHEGFAAWQSGVESARQLLVQALQRAGVTAIADPTGKAFDPNLHCAMKITPHPSLAENHVISVLQQGYLLHQRLLRPALVEVCGGAISQQSPSAELNAANPK